MCGICGFYSQQRKLDTVHIASAIRTLAHRGPDGSEQWVHPEGIAGLGHTRLAIIDIETGQQPMWSADRRFAIVFNGEIYNYRQLRRELEGHGSVFRTQSDTEALLNAYQKWGEDALLRLDGMFALAIFDCKDRKLFLARDRTGVKPLYYHCDSSGMVFGSELKALLAWPHVQRRIDRQAITDFLMLGHPLLPTTAFRDCRELEPGCFLEVSTGGVRKGRYWSWTRAEESRDGADPLALLEQELKIAVQDHLVSDVPIGAFLSGGIDSSLIVALAAAQGGRKFQTFNVRFNEAAYDESQYARAVATHVGTEHHEIVIANTEQKLEIMEKVVGQFDQPFADSSAIPTYLICQQIRKHVKVVLGGDGGDEMFGGYERFAYADVAGLLAGYPPLVLKTLAKLTSGVFFMSRDTRRQFGRLLNVAQLPSEKRLMALCSIIQQEELARVLQPDFLSASRNGTQPGRFANANGGSGGTELIDATVTSTLPGDYLRKIDVMSSAHGLEVRVPMLSNRIVSFATHLPNRLKYSLFKNKILLRKLAAKYLPAEVANKRKQGFGIPLDTWLESKGREEVSSYLSNRSARIWEIFRPDYLRAITSQFFQGEWDRSEISRFSMYQRVYALWSLEHWLQQWKPSW
jgi:asparagine synthase (glutamine-hydrolysing)